MRKIEIVNFMFQVKLRKINITTSIPYVYLFSEVKVKSYNLILFIIDSSESISSVLIRWFWLIRSSTVIIMVSLAKITCLVVASCWCFPVPYNAETLAIWYNAQMLLSVYFLYPVINLWKMLAFCTKKLDNISLCLSGGIHDAARSRK